MNNTTTAAKQDLGSAHTPELLKALNVAADELTRMIERGNDSSREALSVVCKAISKAAGGAQ